MSLKKHCFKRKVKNCKKCGEKAIVSGSSVGCHKCNIYWQSTGVPYLELAIIRWNELNE